MAAPPTPPAGETIFSGGRGAEAACTGTGNPVQEVMGILGNGLFTSCGCRTCGCLSLCLNLSVRMALETVPKDLRHLRACLLCSLVKVSVGALIVEAIGEAKWEKEGEMGRETGKKNI